jgi:uncharacterized protein (TIGR00369 family)
MSDSPPLQELQKTLGQQRLVTFEPGRAAIEYLAGAHMCHSGGVVQGGFICGWIDAAMAHAVMAGGGDMTPMSLELKVSFFAPARPGLVLAEAWIERAGKSTCFAEGRLLDAAGEVLAKATSTIRLIPRAKVEAGSKAAMG